MSGTTRVPAVADACGNAHIGLHLLLIRSDDGERMVARAPPQPTQPNLQRGRMELSRRDLMKYGVLGSAALVLPLERVARTKALLSDRMPTSKLPKPYTLPFQTPPVPVPYKRDGDTDFYNMHMVATSVPVLGPGKPRTTIWGYAMTDAAGNVMPATTPGPTIHVERGRRIAIRHCQQLPKIHPDLRYEVQTSVHLHGSASLPQYDGYASDVTEVDHFKDYHYPNLQDARTLWYHDHGVHHTASNAYMGLAAEYVIHDETERRLNIPLGAYDVPLVMRDATFAQDGRLIYDDNSESGVYGDVTLVNGVPWPNMQVERRKYRFRILNASVSRSFKWSLSTGDPLTVIGTDGGLMPAPQAVGSFRHGMAERYEVVIDFSKYAIGQKIQMLNDSPDNNIDFDTTRRVMQFEVVRDPVIVDGKVPNNDVPSQLNDNPDVMGLQPSDAVRTRSFSFERKHGHWTINGETWEDVILSDYKHVVADPGVGDIEIWELENDSGGWFHPVHIHLIDFKIIDRNGRPPFDFEKGPKDVVYVGENEKVRVMMKFDDTRGRSIDLAIREADYARRKAAGELRPGETEPVILPPRTGRYMMHCHNLVHEDHDMMVQFEVGEGGAHPIEAAPEQSMDIEPGTPLVAADC
jgi:spore coat protein A, manganese oxidase